MSTDQPETSRATKTKTITQPLTVPKGLWKVDWLGHCQQWKRHLEDSRWDCCWGGACHRTLCWWRRGSYAGGCGSGRARWRVDGQRYQVQRSRFCFLIDACVSVRVYAVLYVRVKLNILGWQLFAGKLFCNFGLKHKLQVLNFAICTRKWYKINKF